MIVMPAASKPVDIIIWSIKNGLVVLHPLEDGQHSTVVYRVRLVKLSQRFVAQIFIGLTPR